MSALAKWYVRIVQDPTSENWFIRDKRVVKQYICNNAYETISIYAEDRQNAIEQLRNAKGDIQLWRP